MKIKLFLSLFLLMVSSNMLACDIDRANACMNFGPEAKCLEISKCSKDEFYRLYCPNFRYADCLDVSSEDKCQKRQNDCQKYTIENYTSESPVTEIPAMDRSNLEGYLGILNTSKRIGQNLTALEFSDFSLGPKKRDDPTVNCGGAAQDPGANPAGQTPQPKNFLSTFLGVAERFGNGVKRYALGSYQAARTDCSGFLMQSMKRAGMRVMGPQFDLAPNYPFLFKRCDPKNLKPGDLLLLNKPGRDPDHWIMVTSEGKWPSGEIDIMDVSSDYVKGNPFFKGELSKRRNLQARKVYSCMRHRDLDK